MAIGHAYLSAHTHHRRAKGVVSLSSPCTMARLIRQPTNTLVAKAPTGSSTLDGTKSMTSKKVLFFNAGSQPSGCHPDHRLNDSTPPTPRSHAAGTAIATALARETPRRCCSQATSGSNPAIVGV